MVFIFAKICALVDCTHNVRTNLSLKVFSQVFFKKLARVLVSKGLFFALVDYLRII